MNSVLTGLMFSLRSQGNSSPHYCYYIGKITNDFPIHFLGFICSFSFYIVSVDI